MRQRPRAGRACLDRPALLFQLRQRRVGRVLLLLDVEDDDGARLRAIYLITKHQTLEAGPDRRPQSAERLVTPRFEHRVQSLPLEAEQLGRARYDSPCFCKRPRDYPGLKTQNRVVKVKALPRRRSGMFADEEQHVAGGREQTVFKLLVAGAREQIGGAVVGGGQLISR